jgi:hypothetical protein
MSGSGLKNTTNLVFAAILFFLTDANLDAGVGEIAVGEMLKSPLNPPEGGLWKHL